MGKLDISIIILTYNEEIHLRRCLENIKELAKDIFIIDSFSTDRTLEIAREYNTVILQQMGKQSCQTIELGFGTCLDSYGMGTPLGCG